VEIVPEISLCLFVHADDPTDPIKQNGAAVELLDTVDDPFGIGEAKPHSELCCPPDMWEILAYAGEIIVREATSCGPSIREESNRGSSRFA
jgi:hypothetical protein